MQLKNSFSVPAEPDDAFAALLDVERIAPCMPGAELTGRDGEVYQGQLKLRIGPITVAYQGTVTVEDSDHERRRARLNASGSEMGGQGAASAMVVAEVVADGEGRSRVDVVTDLDIRGKAAQFGRGALGEVTQRILDQFARNLEATFSMGDGSAQVSRVAGAPPRSTSVGPPTDVEDLDVLRAMAGPLLTRTAPVVGALVVGFLLGRATRRTPAPTWGPPPWWSASGAPGIPPGRA